MIIQKMSDGTFRKKPMNDAYDKIKTEALYEKIFNLLIQLGHIVPVQKRGKYFGGIQKSLIYINSENKFGSDESKLKKHITNLQKNAKNLIREIPEIKGIDNNKAMILGKNILDLSGRF